MLVRDYFDGYRASAPHPMMTSTGSEGRCDICGLGAARDHDPPWTRVEPKYVEQASDMPLPLPELPDKPLPELPDKPLLEF